MGQVFTPNYIVNEILDNVRFIASNTFTYKIMEPSFGDGAFLIEIIQRIIENGRLNGLNDNIILNAIINNVYGIEKDSEFYNIAIKNIHHVLYENGIPKEYAVFPICSYSKENTKEKVPKGNKNLQKIKFLILQKHT